MTKLPPDDLETALRACLARGGSHVHLLGICGVGMAGVARLLKGRGFLVSGCDVARAARAAGWLERYGIDVHTGHDPAHLDGVGWVIRSTAVRESDPEIQAARARGLPVFRRGEVLPVLMRTYARSVAVSGTHGKTSTTSFIVQLLRHAGRHPGWCIGGDVPGLDGVAGEGRDDCLVVEADESDGTLTGYTPEIGVVTNIEFDHMEHFRDVADFEACFGRFIAQSGTVVYCVEDPRARALVEGSGRSRERLGGASPTLGYGFDPDAAVSGSDLTDTAEGQAFTLWFGGKRCGEVTLPIRGEHQARNALGAAAAALKLGLTPAEIVAGLGQLKLPLRRFEVVVSRPDVTVISDYAHHPTEVAAIVRTAAGMPFRRRLAVYQPHRYTRTRALGADFPAAFAGLDQLVLAPVYAASEAPLRGGSIWDLYGHFRVTEDRRIPVPVVAGSLREAWEFLRRELQPGDLLLVIGAGDVESMAQWAAAELGGAPSLPLPGVALDGLAVSTATAVRHAEPLAPKTNYGVGGRADVWMEIGNEADLREVLRWTHAQSLPFTLVGGGYNLLVSDLGVRGVVARLTGLEFCQIREENGLVIGGAGVPLSELLDWLEARRIGGFEFLEGIPGTLGGGMQMNAGAWGGCLGDHLAWIRCLNRTGEACIVPREGLDLGYRRCAFLRDRVMVEAAFRLREGDPAAIAARRIEIREKRAWMAGYRSAGSFFKNPEGAKVGRLLEDVGMHGQRVGGAVIGTHHANFVTTEGAATAADVQALTRRGWEAVREKFGIELEAEVKFLA